MIECKRYLELCRKNALNEKSALVFYKGMLYQPLSLSIWFDNKGEARNTAVLKDVRANSIVNGDLNELSELTN